MDSPPFAGKSVALVLGSGGARGLAHIGVIEHIIALGFDIRYIAGSSMGAVVGGIFAAGKLDSYAAWARGLQRRDIISLLDLSFGLQGLFKGERIIAELKHLTGERNIEDLDIGFTAVATDIHEQREVWINRGPLFDAIRASTAMPTVFTPHHHMGRVLVDGGLLNPVPIAPALNQDADLIIAVTLNGRQEGALDTGAGRVELGAPEVPGVFDLISMTVDTMQTSISRMKLAAYSPDVVIEIPRNVCTFYEYHKAEMLIELGREKAQAVLGPAD